MAQQQYRREVTQIDEQGNPVQKIDEHGNVVQTDTGIRVEREFRHTGEQRPTGGTTLGDCVSTGGGGGTGTGTYGTDPRQGIGTIGRATEGTRTDYASGDRSTNDQTGFQGLGMKRGPTSGTTGPETGFQGEGMERRTMGGHQGLGQGLGTNKSHATGGMGTGYTSGGRSTGQTGYQGLGTEPGPGGHHQGQETDSYGHQGVDGNVARATGGTGTDYTSGGRSVGQTGYQGLGTEPGSGGGIGTGTGARYGTDEQQQSTTTGGYGDTREKKGMMEKIKEKLPGHH